MSELILVRHGETKKNVEGILHATGDAETLSDVGVDQIIKTAEKLRSHSPSHIYSSDEPRAIQSGQMLSERIGVPFDICKRA